MPITTADIDRIADSYAASVERTMFGGDWVLCKGGNLQPCIVCGAPARLARRWRFPDGQLQARVRQPLHPFCRRVEPPRRLPNRHDRRRSGERMDLIEAALRANYTGHHEPAVRMLVDEVYRLRARLEAAASKVLAL